MNLNFRQTVDKIENRANTYNSTESGIEIIIYESLLTKFDVSIFKAARAFFVKEFL